MYRSLQVVLFLGWSAPWMNDILFCWSWGLPLSCLSKNALLHTEQEQMLKGGIVGTASRSYFENRALLSCSLLSSDPTSLVDTVYKYLVNRINIKLGLSWQSSSVYKNRVVCIKKRSSCWVGCSCRLVPHSQLLYLPWYITGIVPVKFSRSFWEVSLKTRRKSSKMSVRNRENSNQRMWLKCLNK